MKNKRIIILLDGTWNIADNGKDTHIVDIRNRLFRTISSKKAIRDVSEVVNISSRMQNGIDKDGFSYFIYYQEGVGTEPFDRIRGGVFGVGLDRGVRRAYKFLSENFEPGCEVFVFGFSRGAYTARTLVGFLSTSGLLKRENCIEDAEGFAWKFYRTRPADRLPGDKWRLDQLSHPREHVRISCLGVFDTVGSLGVPLNIFNTLNRKNFEFHDVELTPIVDLCLQALAVDERRKLFEPSIWRQSHSKAIYSVVEQTWFSGSHSDIGGGYYSVDERADLECSPVDLISFDWMMKRVLHHYPKFPLVWPELKAGHELSPSIQHNSRKSLYKFWRPRTRVIANRRPPDVLGETLIADKRRRPPVRESIHVSVLERLARKVPIDNVNSLHLYVPDNVIACLPGLKSFYSQDSEVRSDRYVYVTDWDGYIVDSKSPDNRFKNIKEIVLLAEQRLLRVYGRTYIKKDSI